MENVPGCDISGMEPPTLISAASVLVVPFVVRFWRWTKRRV